MPLYKIFTNPNYWKIRTFEASSENDLVEAINEVNQDLLKQGYVPAKIESIAKIPSFLETTNR